MFDVHETSECGQFRVRIVRDECAMEPDWDEPGEDEMQAWREGDVYGWTVEQRVTWTTDSRMRMVVTGSIGEFVDGPDVLETWEYVDSCWGYYGHTEYLTQTASEALAYVLTCSASVT